VNWLPSGAKLLPAVPSNSTNRSATVPAVAGTFSPQRPLLKLDNHGYSPALFQQIVELSGQLRSFQQAALALRVLTQIDSSGRQSARLTQEIGVELAKARDAKVLQHRRHFANRPGNPYRRRHVS